MKISVILPVYNEEENLKNINAELLDVFASINTDYEIIYVDDGSIDNSHQIIEQFSKTSEKIKSIRFKKNFGQTAALMAGVENSKGDIVIFIDADLQNDPKDIIKMIELINDGYDVVSGWRINRNDPLLKKIPSKIANKIISSICGLDIHDFGCTLKAYKREIIKNINIYGEMHRFIPVYAKSLGARIIEMPVNHRPRIYGKSKYGLSRIVKVILDLFTLKLLMSYNTNPMHLFGKIGILIILTGILSVSVAIYDKIYKGVWMHRNPLVLLSAVCILLGVQFIFNGLLAELLIRIFYSLKKNKSYSIMQKTNFDY
ncbi:glycosyltransferase family 2 protein [Candidatus Dependentiae bacterium]|nr:glycosyltransferase family 2 protein [Candidatus Dependentiae bacterium]